MCDVYSSYDQATPNQEGIALIFTALAYRIVAIFLVFQMLRRLALIDMLIVLGPVAALLWVLPQTQGWFRWWADLFPITVFQQAVQVMVLSLGTALMRSLLRSRHSQAGLWNVVTLVAASRAVGAIGGAAAGGRGGGAPVVGAPARREPKQVPVTG